MRMGFFPTAERGELGFVYISAFDFILYNVLTSVIFYKCFFTNYGIDLLFIHKGTLKKWIENKENPDKNPDLHINIKKSQEKNPLSKVFRICQIAKKKSRTLEGNPYAGLRIQKHLENPADSL
jgi:hypothetical protein